MHGNFTNLRVIYLPILYLNVKTSVFDVNKKICTVD